MSQGWIKLHRQITEWEWYGDSNTFRLFMHLLLTCNHKDKKWKGQIIKVGEMITSYTHLAKETNLSVQKVRTALFNLEATHEVTRQSNTKYTLLKLNNYAEYQNGNTPANKQITNEQQTNNKQITTNKNDKNEENDKNDKNIVFDIFWKTYKKSADKEKCNKKWNSLSDKERTKAIDVLQKYIDSTPDKQYRKNPLTWLNGKCWNDEVIKTDYMPPEVRERILRHKANLNIEPDSKTIELWKREAINNPK